MARTEIDGDQILDESVKAVDVDVIDVSNAVLANALIGEHIDKTTDTPNGQITLGVSSNHWDHFFYSLSKDFTIPLGKSKIITSELTLNEFCLEVDGILEVS